MAKIHIAAANYHRDIPLGLELHCCYGNFIHVQQPKKHKQTNAHHLSLGFRLCNRFLLHCVSKTYALIQLGVVFVHPLLNLYSGKRGKVTGIKWFFYIYYPLHLIVIGILRLLMYGDVSLLF